MKKDLISDKASNFFKEEFGIIFNQNGSNETISSHYFIVNYKSIMIRYISNGKPSEDTKNSYFSNIDQFLEWCSIINMDPFKINEQHLLYYRSMLINKNYKPSSVKFKLTAIRRFYFVAMKYKLINENPALDIHAQRDPDAYIPIIKFLTLNQLQSLISSIDEETEKELRTKTIVYLMALEGLRTIEVYRMNIQDINFELGMIYIKGKGHNDMIYPSEKTMRILNKYINMRFSAGDFPTPVFTSTSNNQKGHRISRTNIRVSITEALKKLGLKIQGQSCHMLRHTCGTLLYGSTKDLQVVKKVLRHRNIEMTSRYSHVQDALLNRYTNAIPIK